MKIFRIALPRLRSLAHKGSLAVLDQGLFAGTNFLVNILLARWLSPQDYGGFVLAFSIFLFLIGFHNALILDPMSVFGPLHYKHCPLEYLYSLLWIHSGLTFCLALLLLSAAGVFLLMDIHFPVVSALLGFGFGTPFILLLYLFRRAFYLQHHPRGALEATLFYSVCILIGLIILNKTGLVSSFSVSLLIGLASLLSSGISYCRLMPCFQKEDNVFLLDLTRVFSENWQYGKWLVAVTFVQWLSGNIYYVFTAGFLGFEETGTLRALLNFVLPLGHIITALQLVLLPWAASHLAKRGLVPFQRSVMEITGLMTVLAGAYALLLSFSAEPLMHIFYGGRYQAFVWLIPWFAVSFFISTLGIGCGLGLKVTQAPRAIFLVTCVGAAITVLLGSILVHQLGLEGIVLGAIVSNASEVLLIAWYWRRVASQRRHEVLI